MSNYNYVKKDISDFIDSFENLEQKEEELFRFISKKIIFLKEIRKGVNKDLVNFYLDQIISDLIYLLSSYNKNEMRYVYFNMRSVIEAFARLFLEIELGIDRVTMTSLLGSIQEYISINELKDANKVDLDYARFKGIYSKCCQYVHGHINAEYSLIEYFKSINQNSYVGKNINNIRNDIKFMINFIVTIACYRFATTLNDIFLRGKDRLSFYIGDFNLSVIKKYSNFVLLYFLDDQFIKKIVLTDEKGKKIKYLNFSIEEFKVINYEIPESIIFEDYDIIVRSKLIRFAKSNSSYKIV